MTHEGAASDAGGRDRAERARHDLFEFLSDTKPALFVAESLAYLLRTEPPYNVESGEPAELIAVWADERSRVTHVPVSVAYLNGLRRILEANRERPFPCFDPGTFIDAAQHGLMRHCPASEVGGLLSGLRDLREGLARRATRTASGTLEAETLEIRGVRMSIRDAQEAAVSHMEHEAYMSETEFAVAFEDVERSLQTRLGIPIHNALSRLAVASAKVFNTGRVSQAGRICQFLTDSFDRLSISPEGRLEVKFAVGEKDVNEGLLAKALNDPEQRTHAASFVRFVGYTSPGEALVTLAVEKRRERRRLLLACVEAHGSDAYPIILDHLVASSVGNQPWFATRNLLYLLSRIDAPDDVARRRAIEAGGRYITHDQPQLRTAALGALRRVGGRDVIPYVVRALDPVNYMTGSIDDSDALRRHLHQAMETLVETRNEAAIAIVAEFATGARGTEFDLGQSLRDEACGALMHVAGPLPRRAVLIIVGHLSQICGKRFKFVTGRLSFGLDAHACRMLSTLLRSSTEPEAVEVLENPVLTKVLTRTSGELA